MRFARTQPDQGDLRDYSRFLWLPKTIKYQTRWLEHASWTERCELFGTIIKWVPMYWRNK